MNNEFECFIRGSKHEKTWWKYEAVGWVFGFPWWNTTTSCLYSISIEEKLNWMFSYIAHAEKSSWDCPCDGHKIYSKKLYKLYVTMNKSEQGRSFRSPKMLFLHLWVTKLSGQLKYFVSGKRWEYRRAKSKRKLAYKTLVHHWRI